MNYDAVIVASGKGERANLGYNKTFYRMKDNKSVLMHSVDLFCSDPDCKKVVIVTNEAYFDQIPRHEKIVVTKGGLLRKDSVYNGLKRTESDYVLIHDGARPFLDDEIIGRCLEGVEETGACVAAVPSKDTVKLADDNDIVTSEPPRKQVWNMQTPQVFYSQILHEACVKASEADRDAGITDDARMVSIFTETKIKLVMGSYENIKITTPVDVLIAGKILEDKIGHIS